MEKGKKKEYRHQSNGYTDGYGYPVGYYNDGKHEEKEVPAVKGSFWVPCSKKAKGRHSFCDEQ